MTIIWMRERKSKGALSGGRRLIKVCLLGIRITGRMTHISQKMCSKTRARLSHLNTVITVLSNIR